MGSSGFRTWKLLWKVGALSTSPAIPQKNHRESDWITADWSILRSGFRFSDSESLERVGKSQPLLRYYEVQTICRAIGPLLRQRKQIGGELVTGSTMTRVIWMCLKIGHTQQFLTSLMGKLMTKHNIFKGTLVTKYIPVRCRFLAIQKL